MNSAGKPKTRQKQKQRKSQKNDTEFRSTGSVANFPQRKGSQSSRKGSVSSRRGSRGSQGRISRKGSKSSISSVGRKSSSRISKSSFGHIYRKPKTKFKDGTGWYTEDVEELISESNNTGTVSCVSKNGTFYAIWMGSGLDGKGKAATMYEHYWTIKFDKVMGGAAVGLSTPDNLAIERTDITTGLFYGICGHLSTSSSDQQQNNPIVTCYGPPITSFDNVGILVSFTSEEGEEKEKRIRLYFYLNGRCLGLAFDVPSSVFPNGLYPAIVFKNGRGSATIQKRDAKQVTGREREIMPYTGIQGSWKIVKGSIEIDGEPFTASFQDILQLHIYPSNSGNGGSKQNSNSNYRKQEKIDRYFVLVICSNYTSFFIQRTTAAWKKIGEFESTSDMKKGNTPTSMHHFDKSINNLLEEPELVTVEKDGQMTVIKGGTKATFTRILDSDSIAPKPFVGIPPDFQVNSGQAQSKIGDLSKFVDNNEKGWITEDRGQISMQDDLVLYQATGQGESDCSAMFVDGAPVRLSDHYWIIHIISLSKKCIVTFGCTERSRLAKGSTRGLFYNYPQKFGPTLKSGDKLGMLISFPESEPKVQVFFYLNGQCLGMAFNVLKRFFPMGLYPCIEFESRGGSCKASARIIRVEPFDFNRGFPKGRNRNRPSDRGIEGTWDAVKGSIRIFGEPFNPSSLDGVILIIGAGRCINMSCVSPTYHIFIHVINSVWFDVKKKGDIWTFVEGTRGERDRTRISQSRNNSVESPGQKSWGEAREEENEPNYEEYDPELLELDKHLSDWVFKPDNVSCDGDHMVIMRESSKISFVRRGIVPFRGNPFRIPIS